VYAISFSAGLDQKERETFCRGLAKISIGALAYLLIDKGIKRRKIKRLFSQTSIDSMRRFALKLPESGSPTFLRFSLGRTDILSQLQRSCEHPLKSNHVIEIDLREKKNIRIQGMLYSKYGWQLDLSNNVLFDFGTLRLENTIADMSAPKDLRDLTLSPDSIVIVNPDYRGQEPTIPRAWKNIT
jgi:hypothetical protein